MNDCMVVLEVSAQGCCKIEPNCIPLYPNPTGMPLADAVVLRGKCRYRRSEIDRLLADCTVAEDAATLTELKRNHTLRTGGGKPKGRRT